MQRDQVTPGLIRPEGENSSRPAASVEGLFTFVVTASPLLWRSDSRQRPLIWQRYSFGDSSGVACSDQAGTGASMNFRRDIRLRGVEPEMVKNGTLPRRPLRGRAESCRLPQGRGPQGSARPPHGILAWKPSA